MLKHSQIKQVWEAVRAGRKRREIASEFNISVKQVDWLYELARQRWGRGPRVVKAKEKVVYNKPFERPKAEYSNKSFWNE